MELLELLQTKFLIPPYDPVCIPRPRLIEWLNRNDYEKLLIISAPAGFGKTTLLSHFARAASANIAWYQIQPSDNDSLIFIRSLVEALRKMKRTPDVPEFGGEATVALLHNIEGDYVDHERIMTVLINELLEAMNHPPWRIVIDDYHLITNPKVHELMDYFIENAPPGLQVIISTRTEPPLSVAKLRSRGKLGQLHSSELRFTLEEVKEWVQSFLPSLPEKSIRILSEKTDGWAAALQIVLHSVQHQDVRSAERFIEHINGSHPFIFDYLAEEVFRRLPEEYQEFLLSTSILTQLDRDSCNALLHRTDSHSLLEKMEKLGFAVPNAGEGHRSFQYRQLFREFLREKLQREHPGRMSRLASDAGEYYERTGDWEQAYEYYISAGMHERAARVMELFAPDFVERGQIEALNRHFSQLSGKVLKQHPRLMLQRGNVLRRLGEAGAAVSSYEDALWEFEKIGDRAGASQAMSRLAEINYSQGHYRRAQELASRALSQTTPEDHAEIAYALMILAKSVGFLEGMDKGYELAERAMEEATKAGERISPIVLAALSQSIGQISWWRGDPQATIRYCEEALRILPDELSPTAARAYTTLTSPYLYMSNLDKALFYAEKGLDIAQTLHLVELLPSAYTALGNVLTRTGEIVRAESTLRQAVEMAQRLGIASYERIMAIGYLAYNLMRQGRLDEAQQLADSALWLYTGNPDTYEVYVCRSVLGDIALAQGKLSKAEQIYKELLTTGLQRNFRIPLAMVHFGLSYIYLTTGRENEGMEQALRSLELIEPTKAVQLFLDQGDLAKVVCHALSNGGHESEFVQEVLKNLSKEPLLFPKPYHNMQGVVVKTFGRFRVFVGGREITREQWTSAKARDLLAYFVTFRRERIPAERVFDALWRDKAGRGKAAFYTALSRLRKALRRGNQTSKFIMVESGEYWLDTARFSLDVDEFDAALAQARSATAQESALRWYQRALNIYEGEYMENLYYEWVFPEQRRLEQAYLSTLVKVAEIYLERRRYEDALNLMDTAIGKDPFSEEFYRIAMQAYAKLGEKSEIVRTYQALERHLRDEMGIEPTDGTRNLYRTLLSK